MNHFPNPIRCTLALPDDVNLADVDWSPISTVETATPQRTGHVADPAERGRGKRKHHTDTKPQQHAIRT
jgi:hypothetical protein